MPRSGEPRAIAFNSPSSPQSACAPAGSDANSHGMTRTDAPLARTDLAGAYGVTLLLRERCNATRTHSVLLALYSGYSVVKS